MYELRVSVPVLVPPDRHRLVEFPIGECGKITQIFSALVRSFRKMKPEDQTSVVFGFIRSHTMKRRGAA